MTINELQTKLTEWSATKGGEALLTSDFGCLEVLGSPELHCDLNLDGTQPSGVEGSDAS